MKVKAYTDLVVWQKAVALATEVHRATKTLFEVQTQVHISKNLQHLAPETAKSLLEQTDEVGRLLNGLLGSLGDQPLATGH